jgi:hypothetical protein
MHCWEVADRVPGQPSMTAFRRGLRLHQARWRQAQGHPIGSQPIVPRAGARSRPVGSRLPLEHARRTGATFVTAAARQSARARSAVTERHQSLDGQRLWADLLSSTALGFNLFGDLAADPRLADRAVRRWWPDVPGTVEGVLFEHSPGRLDPAYLANLSAFTVAVVLDLGDGQRGVLGVEVAYAERTKAEVAKPTRLARYREVADRSGAFAPGASEVVDGSDLPWLEHLLVLSMLQHPGAAWRWGRLVVVHPAGNSSIADACDRYRQLLVDRSTFSSVTLEELIDAGALPASTVAALRARYLP